MKNNAKLPSWGTHYRLRMEIVEHDGMDIIATSNLEHHKILPEELWLRVQDFVRGALAEDEFDFTSLD